MPCFVASSVAVVLMLNLMVLSPILSLVFPSLVRRSSLLSVVSGLVGKDLSTPVGCRLFSFIDRCWLAVESQSHSYALDPKGRMLGVVDGCCPLRFRGE